MGFRKILERHYGHCDASGLTTGAIEGWPYPLPKTNTTISPSPADNVGGSGTSPETPKITCEDVSAYIRSRESNSNGMDSLAEGGDGQA